MATGGYGKQKIVFPDPETKLCSLSGRFRNLICDTLDSGGAWETLMRRLPLFALDENDQYHIKKHTSPTEKLVIHILANQRGWTVGDLIYYLDLIKHETLLIYLKPFQAVYVALQPEPCINVKVGGYLKLEALGVGFPYPRYIWYHKHPSATEFKRLNYCNSEKIINDVNLEQSGIYTCLIYNINQLTNKTTVVYTRDCNVLVLPSPARKESDVPKSQMVVSQCHTKNIHCSAPLIISHPKDHTVKLGHSVCFAFIVTHADTFVWFKDDLVISENTFPSFEIFVVGPEDEGNFFCIASNAYGRVRSKTARLIIDTNPDDCEMKYEKPMILNGPTTEHKSIGQSATFKVLVTGTKPLTYMWFKDNRVIPNSNNLQLNIPVNDKSDQGKFYCVVTDKLGEKDISPEVELVVQKSPFMATDKIFLAIGCSNFRGSEPLTAPKDDICSLREVFQEMNFKVIVLHDLDLCACLNVVKRVNDLINSGVYVVAYFAGHGFMRNGQYYYVPIDGGDSADTDKCLCIEYVLQQWQAKAPALVFLMCDFCLEDIPGRAGPKYEVPVHGNQVLLFATSKNQLAFEVKRSSFFAFSLLGSGIVHDKALINVCNEVILKIQSQIAGVRQRGWNKNMYPELHTNLKELRSLRDPVIEESNNQVLYHNNRIWESVQKIPPQETILSITHRGKMECTVYLRFEVVCDNVLCAIVEIRPSTHASCVAYISKHDGCRVAFEDPWNISPDTQSNLKVPETDHVYYDSRDCYKTMTYLTELHRHYRGIEYLDLVVTYEDEHNQTQRVFTLLDPYIDMKDIMIIPWELGKRPPEQVLWPHHCKAPDESLEPFVQDVVGFDNIQ